MDVHLSEHGQTTADKVHRREEFRLLIADVQELPETQRTALLLREIDALSYEQIAEAMETTVPSVKSLLVRARVSLAEAAEARLLSCEEVRDELGEVAEGLTRTTAPVRRHLRTCERCATFRKQLRADQQGARRALPGRPAAPAQEDAARPPRHDRRGRRRRRGAPRAARPPRAAAAAAGRAQHARHQDRRRPRRRGDRHRRRRRGQARRPQAARARRDRGRRRRARRAAAAAVAVAAPAAAQPRPTATATSGARRRGREAGEARQEGRGDRRQGAGRRRGGRGAGATEQHEARPPSCRPRRPARPTPIAAPPTVGTARGAHPLARADGSRSRRRRRRPRPGADPDSDAAPTPGRRRRRPRAEPEPPPTPEPTPAA